MDWTEKWLNFVLKMDLLKVFLAVDRGWKEDSFSLQEVYLLLSYTTPFRTSCEGVWWKITRLMELWFDTFWKKGQFGFHPLFALTNAFKICIFEREFSYLLKGVGLGG